LPHLQWEMCSVFNHLNHGFNRSQGKVLSQKRYYHNRRTFTPIPGETQPTYFTSRSCPDRTS
jgi:hypothetical protein